MAFLTAVATLTPSPLPGGLLGGATPLTDVEWWRGVDILPGGCLQPFREGPCSTEEASEDPLGEVSRFEPMNTRQGVRCSTLGGSGVNRYAEAAVTAAVNHLLALELEDGTATGNPSLSDATLEGSFGRHVLSALACLEQAAVTGLSGRMATIHLPAGAAVLVADHLRRDGGNWRTPAGNLVVVSSGYSGTHIYATGEVWAAIGTVDVDSRVDRALNINEGWAQIAGIALYDPCFAAKVAIDVCQTEDSLS